MTVREKIRNWLGTQQRTTVPVAAKEPDDRPNSQRPMVNIPEDPKDMPAAAALSPEEDARLKFTNANSQEERSAVLATHPFFENGNNQAQLDAPLLLAVMKHMTEVYAEHGSSYFRDNSHYDFDDGESSIRNRKPETCKIIKWGNPDQFSAWQNRAFELTREEPGYRDALLTQVAHHLKKTTRANSSNGKWLACVEQLAEQEVFLPVMAMLDEIKKASPANSIVPDFFTKYPILAARWSSPSNDAESLAWAALHLPDGLWLAKHHPRINAWDLAEVLQPKDVDPKRIMTNAIAETTPSGALLKAWYGVEPSAEEVIKHPLAHSLYVHKYAPMYLEEVKPLPTSWQVAMSLATTGREFCDTLLMTAKAQLSNVDTTTLELPDLGPGGP